MTNHIADYIGATSSNGTEYVVTVYRTSEGYETTIHYSTAHTGADNYLNTPAVIDSRETKAAAFTSRLEARGWGVAMVNSL